MCTLTMFSNTQFFKKITQWSQNIVGLLLFDKVFKTQFFERLTEHNVLVVRLQDHF